VYVGKSVGDTVGELLGLEVAKASETVGAAVAVVVGTNVGTLLGAGVGTPIDVKTRVTNPSLEAAALRVTVFAERSTATTVPNTEVDPDPVAGTVVAVAVLPITICDAAWTEVIMLLPLDKTPELGVVTA